MVSLKKRSICKDQWRRNQEKACWNTKRIKKGSTGQTNEEKDWSTRSCEEAQRTCRTTLILVIESITITLQTLLIKFQLLSIIVQLLVKCINYNYLSIRLWEQGRYCIGLGFGASDNSPGLRSHMFALNCCIFTLQVNHDFMLYQQL